MANQIHYRHDKMVAPIQIPYFVLKLESKVGRHIIKLESRQESEL